MHFFKEFNDLLQIVFPNYMFLMHCILGTHLKTFLPIMLLPMIMLSFNHKKKQSMQIGHIDCNSPLLVIGNNITKGSMFYKNLTN